MKYLFKNLRVILAILIASSSFTAISSAQDKKWDEQPKIKKSVAPKNPNKINGMVSAQIVISPDGSVSDIKIAKSTDSLLEQPVTDALKKWLFHPAKLDGKAIECTIKVPFKFQG